MRLRKALKSKEYVTLLKKSTFIFFVFQEIDEILHGQLTDEDEDAALAELDALLAADVIPDLPEAPATEIKGNKKFVF